MDDIHALLALSDYTGFPDFPRFCRLPDQLGFCRESSRRGGRRLVYSQGIYALTVLSALLLIIFGGVTDRLIPLFAIGAFLAFTLSQAGMVRALAGVPAGIIYGCSMLINGLGAVATGVTLAIVLVAKFAEGAWVMTLLVPAIAGDLRRRAPALPAHGASSRDPAPLNVDEHPDTDRDHPDAREEQDVAEGAALRAQLSPEIYVVQVRTVCESVGRSPETLGGVCRGPHARQRVSDATCWSPLPSPYRHVFNPLHDFIMRMRKEHPKSPDRGAGSGTGRPPLVSIISCTTSVRRC